MDALDLLSERQRLLSSLNASYSELWKMSKAKSRTEHDYKVAYRKEVFRLHQQDKVAWTAAITLAHGDTEYFNVAELRFKRDIAKSEYEVAQEKINGLKLSLRMIEAEISREWGQNKNI